MQKKTMQHSQLFTEPKTLWSADDVQFALASADTGDLEAVADFAETLHSDPQIRTAADQRILGLQGVDMYFAEGNEELESSFWELFPAAELAKAHWFGLSTGVALLQMKEVDGRRMAECWHPRWLRYQDYDEQWYLVTKEGEIIIDKDDPNWIMLFPYGQERPWASGLWRVLAFYWVIKTMGWIDWSRNAQATGSPTRVGKAPENSSEKQRTELLTQLRAMKNDNVFVLPPGFEMDYLEATNEGQIYERLVSMANSSFTMVLTGQTITTEGSNMGFGEGNIFDNVKRDLVRFDNRWLTQGLKPWLKYWSRLRATELGKFGWLVEPIDTGETVGSALDALGKGIAALNSALTPSGKKLDVEDLCTKLGYKLKDLPAKNRIERHHIEAGAVTRDEIRDDLGLEPMKGGSDIAQLETSTKSESKSETVEVDSSSDQASE